MADNFFAQFGPAVDDQRKQNFFAQFDNIPSFPEQVVYPASDLMNVPVPAQPAFQLATDTGQQLLGTSARAAFGVSEPISTPVTETPVADFLAMNRIPEAQAVAAQEVAPIQGPTPADLQQAMAQRAGVLAQPEPIPEMPEQVIGPEPTGLQAALAFAQKPSPEWMQRYIEQPVLQPIPGVATAIHYGYQYGSPLGWIEDVAPNSSAGKWARTIRQQLEPVAAGFATPANIGFALTGEALPGAVGQVANRLIALGFGAQQANQAEQTYHEWRAATDPEEKRMLGARFGVELGLTGLMTSAGVLPHPVARRLAEAKPFGIGDVTVEGAPSETQKTTAAQAAAETQAVAAAPAAAEAPIPGAAGAARAIITETQRIAKGGETYGGEEGGPAAAATGLEGGEGGGEAGGRGPEAGPRPAGEGPQGGGAAVVPGEPGQGPEGGAQEEAGRAAQGYRRGPAGGPVGEPTPGGTPGGGVPGAYSYRDPTTGEPVVVTPAGAAPPAGVAARIEAERRQQNINSMAENLYGQALRESTGPGPKDLQAEIKLATQKRAAQIVTGDRDVLAAFDRAHEMATQLAEANHGMLLNENRPQRYIPFARGGGPAYALPDAVRRAFRPSAEGPTPELTKLEQEYRTELTRQGIAPGRGPSIVRVDPAAALAAEGPRGTIAKAEALARAFGLKLTWFRGAERPITDFAGTRGPGEILVNIDAERSPVHIIAAHELTHDLQMSNPGLYRMLADAVKEADRAGLGRYAERQVRRGYQPREIPVERVADFVEETLTDPTRFARALGDKPALAQRVLTHIRDFLDRTLRKLGLRKDESATGTVADIRAARAQVMNVLDAFRSGRQAGLLPTEDFVRRQFARQEPVRINQAVNPRVRNQEYPDIAVTDVRRVLESKLNLANQAAALRKLLPKELTRGRAADVVNNAIDFFHRNLNRAYAGASRMLWAEPASRQYEGYNIYSHTIGREFGRDPTTVMAAESALSPNTSPDNSFEMARRIMQIRRDVWPGQTFDAKMLAAAKDMNARRGNEAPLYDAQDLRYFKGKTYSDLPANGVERAMWLRAYDEAYNPDRTLRVVRPDGELGDYVKTSTGKPMSFSWVPFNQMQRAIDLFDGTRTIPEVLQTPKVSNYFMSKMLAGRASNHVVVDTHHANAAFANSVPADHPIVTRGFRSGKDRSGRFGGQYSLIQEATVRAARDAGLDPKRFQALIWAYQRGFLSPDAFGPTAEGKAASTAIQQLWKDANRGKLTERQAYERTRQIAADLNGQPKPPDYYAPPGGPGGGYAPAQRVAGEPGELPAPGGPPAPAPPRAGGGVAAPVPEAAVRAEPVARAAEEPGGGAAPIRGPEAGAPPSAAPAPAAPTVSDLTRRFLSFDAEQKTLQGQIADRLEQLGYRREANAVRGGDLERLYRPETTVRYTGARPSLPLDVVSGVMRDLGVELRWQREPIRYTAGGPEGGASYPYLARTEAPPPRQFARQEPPSQAQLERDINDKEKMRGHIATIQRMTEVSPAVKGKVESYYAPTTLEATTRQARAVIDRVGLPQARDAFMKSKRVDAQAMALGHEVALRYDAMGRNDPANYDLAAEVRNEMARKATSPAQALWFLSTIEKTSPEGLIREAREATMQSIRDDPAKMQTAQDITQLTQKLAQIPEGKSKQAATQAALEQLKRVNIRGQMMSLGKINNLIEKNRVGKGLTTEELANELSKSLKLPRFTAEDRTRILDAQRKYAEAVAGGDRYQIMRRAGDMMDEVYAKMPRTFWQKLRGTAVISMITHLKLPIRIGISDAFYAGGRMGLDTIKNIWHGDLVRMVTPGKKTITGQQIRAFSEGMREPDAAYLSGYREARGEGKGRIQAFGQGMRTMIDLAQMTTRGLNEATDLKGPRHLFTNRFGKLAEDTVGLLHNVIPYSFWNAAYRSSLVRQMAIAGVDMPTEPMVQMARVQAYRAIFQNDTVANKTLIRIRDALNFGKRPYGLGTASIPFARIPGALLTEGATWSPIGFIRAALDGVAPKLMEKVSGEPVLPGDVIDSILKAGIGSGSLGLTGYWLAQLGVITGARDDDPKVENFRKSMGWGAYSLNLSELKRRLLSGNWWTPSRTPQQGDVIMNYNWLEPAAIPLTMGADAWHSRVKGQLDIKRGKLTANAVLSAVNAAVQSLTDQPLLQGIDQLAKAYAYGKVPGFLTQLVANIPGNFVPSLVREVSQLMDNNLREMKGGSDIEQDWNRIVNQFLPGWSKRFPADYDAAGRAQLRYNYMPGNLINIFLNPARVTTFRSIPGAEEMERLMNATGQSTGIPNDPSRTITINGKQQQLDNEQLATYKRYIGQNYSAMVAHLMSSPGFVRLPDVMKQKILGEAAGAVNTAAKIDLFGEKPIKPTVGLGTIGVSTPSVLDMLAYKRAGEMGLRAPVSPAYPYQLGPPIAGPRRPLWDLVPGPLRNPLANP